MTRHVSAETMAGFRQGGLSPRQNSRISAHLAGCDRCRTLDEDLAGVRTLLAGAQPPPIPDHLAARIQTALATEAASRVIRPAGSENGVRTAAAGPGQPARGSGWLPHLPGMPRLGSRVALGSLAAAAAVLVVIGGMYMFGSRGTGSGPSGTVAGAPAHRAAGQSAGSEIGVPGPGGQAPSGPALRYRHSGHEDSVTPVTTDTDFTPGRLRTQVALAVARYGAKTTGTAPHTNPLSGVISPAAAVAKPPTTFGNIPLAVLQGCVNRIDAGELVLLVDVARYRDTPATVIVTEMTVIGPEQIWVVGTGCSGSHTDMLTRATMAAP
jgi:hypothetical protein